MSKWIAKAWDFQAGVVRTAVFRAMDEADAWVHGKGSYKSVESYAGELEGVQPDIPFNSHDVAERMIEDMARFNELEDCAGIPSSRRND